MEQLTSLCNINTVVAYVLDDLDMQDKYSQMGEKIAQLTIRGFIDMNVNYSPLTVKVIRARLDNNRRITLPNDYMDYTKIGVNINGNIWTLSLNPDMALDRTTCCNLDITEVINNGGSIPTGIVGYWFAPHYFQGNYVGGLWGVGGGWNQAYFRVDTEYRQIQFEGYFNQNCEIVLEYKSTGINYTTETIIPRQYVEPLVAYVHKKRAEQKLRRKDITMGAYQIDEQNYVDAMEKLVMFNTSITADEIMDTLYAEYTQLPKR